MREAKIQCEGVGKTFIQKGNTQVHVLRDVSIDVGRNEFVVILGPGQCGKTTLLRMIAGFEKPSVGRVLMDGREIEGPGHDKGFVFQSYMLFAWRTVRGNVEVGPRVRNLPKEERRRLSQQYIDMPITQALIDALTESVNAYGRKMTGDGAVLGFRCWFDPARNPETELAAGHLLLSYKYTPPPPLERLTFETEITSEYLLTLKGGN